MDFSHYSDVPVEVAVRFTNTLDVDTGEDDLASIDALADFLQRELSEWGPAMAEPTERDLQAARRLRARLRSVWEADSAESAADVINDILGAVDAQPRVSVHGDRGPHLHFEPERGDPVKILGAVTAMGLGVALIEGGWERFGICASATCADVYIDTSKNRSRLHCSDTCTTRESVAAYRARRSAPPDSTSHST